MMSRKDFMLVAESFKRTRPKVDHYVALKASSEQWRKSVKDMTLMFKRVYPRFNEIRFLRACGASASEGRVTACGV